MNVQELIARVLDDADQDVKAAIAALEDGAYLASIGLTDDDQEVVEEAHFELKNK